MKKVKLILILFLTLSLTGCMKKYELTEQQSNVAAEYMAGILLQQDKDYQQKLTPMEDLGQAEASTGRENITPAPASVVNGDGTTAKPMISDSGSTGGKPGTVDNDGTVVKPTVNGTLSEVIGEKNIEAEYTGCKICDTYPEDTDSYFSLTPREGNQLLVATFTVKNLSDKEVKLDLSNSNVVYQLDLNSGTTYKPLLTLLENDLQYINVSIGAGKTEKALLVFETSKKPNGSDVNLIASKGDKFNTIDIK